MRDRAVTVWKLDSQDRTENIFSVELDISVPSSVAFAEESEDVYVFGLYDGNM